MAFSIMTLSSGMTSIAIRGNLDGAMLWGLRRELAGLVQRRPLRVEVELSHLRLIEDEGIEVLLAFFADLARQGCRFTLRGLHDAALASFKAAMIEALTHPRGTVN